MPSPQPLSTAVPRSSSWGEREEEALAALQAGRWSVWHTAVDLGVNVHARDARGNTLLILLAGVPLSPAASEEPLLDAAHALLARGADPNATSLTGLNVLHSALDLRRWPLIRLLVAHGADPRRPPREGGESLLSTAVQLADADTVRVLLDAGADLHALRDGTSILHDLMWAMGQWGDGPATDRLNGVFDLLLERGASPVGAGPNGLPDSPMEAPLVKALPAPGMVALQRLLALGAVRDDPRWKDPHHRLELLITTVREGHAGSMQALLDEGLAQGFRAQDWQELERSVARQEALVQGSPTVFPRERERAQARLGGIRGVVERAALHALDLGIPPGRSPARPRL